MKQKFLWYLLPVLPITILPFVFAVSSFREGNTITGIFCSAMIAFMLVFGYYTNKAFR